MGDVADDMWNESLLADNMAAVDEDTIDIEFDEDTHIYKVNGEVKRSVTQILKAAGVAPDYTDLDPYYADRGTRVHDACELVAQGWITSDSVADDIMAYVKSFESIVERLGLSYVTSEVVCYDYPLWCPHCEEPLDEDLLDDDGNCISCGGEVVEGYDYCGKFDLIMMWEGKRTLVELKTSKFEMYHGLQLAAYERMVKVDDVMGIELKTGKVFVKADDWELNHKAWKDICTGWFVLDDWKKDRNRRRMKVMK